MSMIRKNLLQLVFSGSFMKRWNDKLRPVEFFEVDKQAQKMIVAWILYFLNQDRLSSQALKDELALEVIEGGIFEYLYRLVITDIKPPIFYQIRSNPSHYRQLTDWVFEQLEPRLQALGEGFWERFQDFCRRPDSDSLGKRILAAAHLYASQWEFSLIQGINPWDQELEEIERNFKHSLARFEDLNGVPELIGEQPSPLKSFVHQCGQLRFQKRWSQTPRIPETSVLGHVFVVACFAYFCSMAVKACPRQRANNYFSGLFHDLPELLTRDIISPVKRSVRKIGDLIKEYEAQEVERRVFGLLEEGGYERLSERLKYFLGMELGSEFAVSIIGDNIPREVTRSELFNEYNQDRFDPKDGELLKACDSLAAFIEAYTAMRNGIKTEQLQQAVFRIRQDFTQVDLGNGLHIGSLLADFD
ncbi:MAG: HD domain-containing protein [Desulfohalobiaceae bacterium]|nr:HD domain-containing protein [Desulfohalobiaceae bacterium]